MANAIVRRASDRGSTAHDGVSRRVGPGQIGPGPDQTGAGSALDRLSSGPAQITPKAIMASATLRKPATFAP
ncbi:MAG: hypothetical protein ACTINN_14660, partial [Brachybacterium tyrofermentans]